MSRLTEAEVLAGGQRAVEAVFCNNYAGLWAPALSQEDLQQEGWLGALSARDKYSPDKGCSYSTFAYRNAFWQMTKLVNYQRHTVSGPKDGSARHIRVQGGEVGRHGMRNLVGRDGRPDLEAQSREQSAAMKELAQRVYQKLPERLAEALCLRMQGWLLEEVGQRLGVTKERARQLQNKALAKARRLIEEDPELARLARCCLGE